MKKLLSIALAVVMVLGVASVAMAFDWNASSSTTTNDNFGYKIEVIKYLKETGDGGSSKLIVSSDAAAINDASVYFAVRLTVTDADTAASANVTVEGVQYPADRDYPNIGHLDEGTYYWTGDRYANYAAAWVDQPQVIEAKCTDTDTLKVSASVKVEQDLDEWFTYGNYQICKPNDTTVFIGEGHMKPCVQFTLNNSGKVTAYQGVNNITQEDADDILAFVGGGSVDAFLNAFRGTGIYMTDSNLRANFAPTFTSSDSENWAASSTPIILDPIVSIPKTGDNASVIGFAMIMVAIVAAAVAVKKVRA